MDGAGVKPLIAILGVSHRDIEAARRWIKWASTLGHHDRIFIMLTIRARALWEDADYPFVTVCCTDEYEDGYPKSAGHLFIRSLEWAERDHPGSPVLWLETDAIPIHAGWLDAIEQEYRSCGKPFMGHLELEVYPKHMAGCGVYPPNWRELSPKLASCMDAPDIQMWGPGRGQAFDTYAADQTFPLSADAQTIMQVWNCPPFTRGMLKMLDGVALFHQSKDGRLIGLLSGEIPVPKPVDIVYPYKHSDWAANELMWSLRSIEKHASDMVRDAVLIGESPEWFTGRVIRSDEWPSINGSQVLKMRAAAMDAGITEDFLWMNKDFYCLSEPDTASVSALNPRYKIRLDRYHKSCFERAEHFLKWRGFDQVKDFELHVPMPMRKAQVIEMLGILPFGDIAFRTVYGNMFHPDAPLMKDVKIRHKGEVIPDHWTWFSTSDECIMDRRGVMANRMWAMYPAPSRWESLP